MCDGTYSPLAAAPGPRIKLWKMICMVKETCLALIKKKSFKDVFLAGSFCPAELDSKLSQLCVKSG